MAKKEVVTKEDAPAPASELSFMQQLGLKESRKLPPRITIYGPHKIGKSSFGASADTPVFIQIENGLDALDVKSFPKAETFRDVMSQLEKLVETDHPFKTVVVDSVDWLEPLIWAEVCEESQVASIELANGGYGKGYISALNIWGEYFQILDYLREHKGMTIIQIAHAQIKRFESPVTDAYDRYEIKLHKLAAAKLLEYSDITLFANYYVGIKKEADSSRQKDDDKRKRAVGSGERILYTEERPAFQAGNRYDLPAEIPFSKDGSHWGVIADHVPFYKL